MKLLFAVDKRQMQNQKNDVQHHLTNQKVSLAEC